MSTQTNGQREWGAGDDEGFGPRLTEPIDRANRHGQTSFPTNSSSNPPMVQILGRIWLAAYQ